MNTWRYVQAVLWSFVGLGRPQDMVEVGRTGKPLPLIAIGVGIAAVFVAVLLGLASFAVTLLTPAS